MEINFAMKETTFSLYSVTVPKELENASPEKLKNWINSGKVFDENIEFLDHLDTVEGTPDTDYRFEIIK